jgi:tetratricopeptide (TPR) repeat protein
MDDILSRVCGLKREANDCFNDANNSSDHESRVDNLRNACILYGQAIEALVEMEPFLDDAPREDAERMRQVNEELSSLRPILFLNLAQANISLGGYDGALRCCNAAIHLCNSPYTRLQDLPASQEDAIVIEPVAPTFQKHMAKALFRRSKCYSASAGLSDIIKALEDCERANRVCPGDKAILRELTILQMKANGVCTPVPVAIADSSETVPQAAARAFHRKLTTHRKLDIASISSEYVHNGGYCWLRKGVWSQTVEDACVYLPAHALLSGEMLQQILSGPDSAEEAGNILSRDSWDVEFKRMAVSISFSGSKDSKPTKGRSRYTVKLDLEHIIKASECSWTIEEISTSNSASELGKDTNKNTLTGPVADADTSVLCLVLHLTKAPSYEWFPGCEWWDRVCKGDEPLDTTTCSVGADVSQLPEEARRRAERESRRFGDLTEEERSEELQRCVSAKRAFAQAESRTRQAAGAEDAAVGEVPERAEMLEALRAEFPGIDFTAK